jgi:effector-binding domain-containing protein
MTAPEPDPPQLVDVEEVRAVVVAGVVPMDELPAFFDRAFGALGVALSAHQVVPQGPAFARYRGVPTATADLEVGFPVAEAIEPQGEVTAGSIPVGRVARVVHHGGYDGLGAAWSSLEAWIGEQGLVPGEDLWEVYLTKPDPDMDPSELRTELNWLVTPAT